MEGEGIVDATLMSEQVVDMLKLLDYENKFCKNKGFKPMNKYSFAVESGKPGVQFLQFVSLVSWLLSINNHQVTGWNKHDDPMTASQNILIELKKLGLELDLSPNKLKTGYGEGVCTVLIALGEISVQNKIKFKRPKISDTGKGGFGDDDGDEFGDEFEGNADLADQHEAKGKAVDSEDDIDDDVEFGVGQVVKDEEGE